MDIEQFWKATLAQDAAQMRAFFCRDGHVNWPCTNERFTVEEFIRANCEYPGDWDGRVERVERLDDGIVTVTRVYPKDRTASFHVTSFFQIRDSKIQSLDEYWAEDGEAPDWRKRMHIGRPIR